VLAGLIHDRADHAEQSNLAQRLDRLQAIFHGWPDQAWANALTDAGSTRRAAARRRQDNAAQFARITSTY
jgi:hypothetical protein